MRETMSVDACYVIFSLCKLSLSPADSGNIMPLVYEVVVGVCNLYGQSIVKSISYYVRTYAFTIHAERQKLMSVKGEASIHK